MKRFSLRLEDELHEKLRAESFKTGISMNKIIVEAIEEKYKGDVGMKETLEYKKEELKKARKKAGIYASDASEVQRLEEEIEELKKFIKNEEE